MDHVLEKKKAAPPGRHPARGGGAEKGRAPGRRSLPLRRRTQRRTATCRHVCGKSASASEKGKSTTPSSYTATVSLSPSAPPASAATSRGLSSVTSSTKSSPPVCRRTLPCEH